MDMDEAWAEAGDHFHDGRAYGQVGALDLAVQEMPGGELGEVDEQGDVRGS